MATSVNDALARWTGQPANNVDITSAAFTPANGSIIEVCIDADQQGSNTGALNFTVSGGSLTWTERQHRDHSNTVNCGVVSIFTAPVVTGASMTISVRRTTTNGGGNRISCKAYVITGQDASPIGAGTTGTSTTNSISPTVAVNGAGRMTGVGTEWQQLGSPTSSDTEAAADYPGEISVMSAYKAADHASGGSQGINFDAAGAGAAAWNYALLEILAAGGDVTVGLTGSALSSTGGALGPAASKALSGSALTGAQGTLVPALSLALTGSALSSVAGTLIPSFSIALTGQALAMAQGSVSAGGDLILALTGQALALSAGTLSPAADKALSGSVLASASGTVVPANSKALSGNAAILAPGSISPAISKALSGNLLASAQGTVTAVTGVTIALTGQSLSFGQGTLARALSVSLNGQPLSALQGTLVPGNDSAVTEIVPYLIEDTLAAALMRIASIRCTANVIGSSGSVTAQDPAHMSVVARGTVITITLGGDLYTSNIGNSRARAPYGAPDAIPKIRRRH